jgi:hypothetical protein
MLRLVSRLLVDLARIHGTLGYAKGAMRLDAEAPGTESNASKPRATIASSAIRISSPLRPSSVITDYSNQGFCLED